MANRRRLGKYLRGLLVTGDFLLLNIAYFAVILMMPPNPHYGSKLVWLLVNVAYIPVSWWFSDIHNNRMLHADRVVLSALKSSISEGVLLLAAFYLFDIVDVGLIYGCYFIGFLFIMHSVWLLVSRNVLKKLRRMGLNFKRVAIIGAGKTGQMVCSEVMGDTGYGYRVMGIFDDNAANLDNVDCGYTAPLDKAAEFIVLNNIDTIFFTLDAEDDQLVSQLMTAAEECGASFVYVPKVNKHFTGTFTPTSVGILPAMERTKSPLTYMPNRIIKRITDILISGTFLIFSPIIFIPIAIAVKMSSPGPIFFKQKRTGMRGKDFWCYKFRTMKVNAESDTRQATKDDPRKTKVGNFLRKTSLDELPQFINVFLGDMSIVGPRPHMVSQTEEYSALIDKYMVRHAIKPGITGWAQINGYRGATKYLWQMEKRVEYDVWYVRNWNLILDFKIIIRTAFNSLHDSNAY